MRATVIESAVSFALACRPEPTAGYQEVVADGAALVMCGSDIPVIDRTSDGTVFPLVPWRVNRLRRGRRGIERCVTGAPHRVRASGTFPPSDVTPAIEVFSAGAIRCAPMISHSFTLENHMRALAMFRSYSGRTLQIRPNYSQPRDLVA